MIERRPFGSADAVRSAARDEWFALSAEEWREAFAQHPRIGDLDGMRRRFSSTRALSEREQSGVCSADVRVLRTLLEANREYEDRFGWIFIVCAAGKSADEMLGLLRERLRNAPDDEMRIAAEEHAKICDLRLTTPV